MTVYYVGPGGNDGLAGTSWASRFLTLGKAATSVAAGDTVYVGPGTYRVTLTIGVSGTAGNVITWIGDYTGANTDGVGGVVRITGSNDDKSATRTTCITATSKNYNTFTGFQLDMGTSTNVNLTTTTFFTFNKCVFAYTLYTSANIDCNGASQSNLTVSNCYFYGGGYGVYLNHTVAVDNAAHAINNCLFVPSLFGFSVFANKVGGVTITNCVASLCGMARALSLTAGQTVTVNNCILHGNPSGNGQLLASTLGEIVEDYNTFFSNNVARINVNTGAHSLTYPPLFDNRWFFQLVFAGAGPNSIKQIASPFDLSAASQLIDVAGTSPTATDMRGTGTIGAQREWGALEYDSTLSIRGGGLLVGPGMNGGFRG